MLMTTQKKHFGKTLYIVIGGVVAAAILGVVFVVLRDSPATGAQPTLISTKYAEAKQTPVVAKCANENADVTIDQVDWQPIEVAAISYLADVPAGTTADLQIASYTDTEVTGSARYEADYGSYNFTLSKQNNNWAVTSFTRCE